MTDPTIVTRAINDAADAARMLRIAARMPSKSASEPVTGGPAEAPAPINLNLFDHAEMIHYCIQGWAKICGEEQGDPLPADETEPLAQHLVQRVAWVAGQSWADDLVTELRDHVHTAEGMLGLLPRRIPVPDPCHCGYQQWAFPGEGEGGMVLECGQGHVTAIRHVVGAVRVSIRGAQRILGIRRETIREALASGDLVNHGTETRPIVDTQAVKTYLTERLRTHSL